MSDPVPLSAPIPAPSRARWGTRADALAVALVLGFAFLAGSFVARNSDVWLHLATGRALVLGDYRLGTDPFAYTTDDRYWANHAWLFDFGLYAAYSQFGGAALVVLKALAVVGTAGAMLAATRGRGPVWVAAGCVLLAVLACGPRLLLQPTIASMLLLAVALCCLRAGGSALKAVPVLIAVWVNLDAWFLLGPALVGLFWVGRRLDPERASLPAWPQWFVPASLGACLLSPHHVFALTLPMELSPAVWSSAFRADPRFAGVFASPWHAAPLGAPGGYNLAAWAFFALLGLGVVSFAANRRAVPGWRLAVWLPFALLAAWQARLIPFFAVVAGPITALNLREVLSETRFARGGRGVVLSAGAALVVLAWFGWTTGFSNRDRATAWGVHTDPSLAHAAEGIARDNAAKFPADRPHVFAAHPDAGHYLAWFAPGELYFFDSRLHLFTHVADKYAAHSRAVGLLDGPAPDGAKNGFGTVLLYDPDPGRAARALRATAGTGDWTLARIDGSAVLLVPTPGAAPAWTEVERGALNGTYPSSLATAERGPSSLAEPDPAWWSVARAQGRSGSWEADASAVYLRAFEGSSSNSPALPLLAVRAARVGVERDPRDPLAWLALGRAYGALGERTWEREAGTGLTPLEYVRQVQTVTALTQSVLRNPGSAPARENLATLLLRRNVLDVARPHAAEALRLARRAGPLPGQTPDEFASRVARLAAVLGTLDATLFDAENRYLIRTTGLAGDPLGRARIAVELGLAQKGIDVLLKSYPDLYGTAGLGLLAEVLLQSGQAAECRVLLDRAELRRNTDALGIYALPGAPNPRGVPWAYPFPTYDWLDLCQSAAVGQYTAAGRAIDRICARLEAEEQTKSPPLATSGAALFVLEIGLGAPPLPAATRVGRARDRARLTEAFVQTKSLTAARADLTTFAGVLHLERGAPADAAGRFADALTLYERTSAYPLATPGRPLAARYQEAMRAAK